MQDFVYGYNVFEEIEVSSGLIDIADTAVPES